MAFAASASEPRMGSEFCIELEFNLLWAFAAAYARNCMALDPRF